MYYRSGSKPAKTDEFNIKLLWVIRKQRNIANCIIYFSPLLFGDAFRTTGGVETNPARREGSTQPVPRARRSESKLCVVEKPMEQATSLSTLCLPRVK